MRLNINKEMNCTELIVLDPLQLQEWFWKGISEVKIVFGQLTESTFTNMYQL